MPGKQWASGDAEACTDGGGSLPGISCLSLKGNPVKDSGPGRERFSWMTGINYL